MALLIFFFSFRTMIHLELIFVYDVRQRSKAIFPYGYPTAPAPFPQLNCRVSPQFSLPATESQFLGRLIRNPGVPKERGVWNSQGGGKDKHFSPLYIL